MPCQANGSLERANPPTAVGHVAFGIWHVWWLCMLANAMLLLQRYWASHTHTHIHTHTHTQSMTIYITSRLFFFSATMCLVYAPPPPPPPPFSLKGCMGLGCGER